MNDRILCSWRLIFALAVFLIPTRVFAAACGTVLSPVTVSATGVNFGTYDPFSSSAKVSEGTIVVACELGVDALPAFTVSLSHGAANSFVPRKLTSGASALSYNMYTTASQTNIWGDGTGETETRTYDGLLVLGHVEFTVYGGIPPGQFVNAGTYVDTIIITIEY